MIISGLTFGYNKDYYVFEDFSFESSEPLIALKGPSGCGKTTLLKIISQNLLPEKNIHSVLQKHLFCDSGRWSFPLAYRC
jgi:ABC-type bacteriocin/lantibiotic exporter with double-glycine peptidase domain